MTCPLSGMTVGAQVEWVAAGIEEALSCSPDEAPMQAWYALRACNPIRADDWYAVVGERGGAHITVVKMSREDGSGILSIRAPGTDTEMGLDAAGMEAMAWAFKRLRIWLTDFGFEDIVVPDGLEGQMEEWGAELEAAWREAMAAWDPSLLGRVLDRRIDEAAGNAVPEGVPHAEEVRAIVSDVLKLRLTPLADFLTRGVGRELGKAVHGGLPMPVEWDEDADEEEDRAEEEEEEEEDEEYE